MPGMSRPGKTSARPTQKKRDSGVSRQSRRWNNSMLSNLRKRRKRRKRKRRNTRTSSCRYRTGHSRPQHFSSHRNTCSRSCEKEITFLSSFSLTKASEKRKKMDQEMKTFSPSSRRTKVPPSKLALPSKRKNRRSRTKRFHGKNSEN